MVAGPAPVVTKGMNGSWWFNIAWSVSGWAVAPKRYEVVVSGGTDNMGTATSTTVQDNGTHTIGASKPYTATVKAFDALTGGNFSSGSVGASTTALEAPKTPSASPSVTSILLNWVKGNDNGRNTYTVKDGGATVWSGSSPGPATLSGLAPGSSHTYTITVTDSTGVSASVTIGPVMTLSYSTPGTPSVSGVGYYQVDASWVKCSEAAIIGYDVELVYSNYTVVTSKTSGTPTSFTGLSSSTTYGVRVRGYDSAGNRTGWSGYGWGVTATPPPPPPTWTHSPGSDLL